MGRIAFYAPLKPPHHPTPSGDREMARNLMVALASGTDWPVELVSDLRVYDPLGDPDRQKSLFAAADAEAARLISDLRPRDFRAWVTYHNYYKAPDLLGPRISAALDIPYVQIEATRAKSRLDGPWQRFAQAAERACDAAALIFYFTALDRLTLARDQTPGQQLIHLRPFLPTDRLPPPARCGAPGRPMLTAAMLRPGDKLASYALLAEALSALQMPDWTLWIAGGGEAGPAVTALMAPFGKRIRFLGQLGRGDLARAYAQAAVFVWPGVNEAFGMVYLEAQAAGLPVVAQDRDGVRDVVAPSDLPDPAAGPAGLARRMDELLQRPELRTQLGHAARAHVARHHLQPQATTTLWSALAPLCRDAA